MPKKMAKELSRWPEVYPSPRSNSYYSVPYNMQNTAGAKRISDHWNIGINGGSFRTDVTIRPGEWALAEYNGAVWVVKSTAPPAKNTTTVVNEKLNIVKR